MDLTVSGSAVDKGKMAVESEGGWGPLYGSVMDYFLLYIMSSSMWFDKANSAKDMVHGRCGMETAPTSSRVVT